MRDGATRVEGLVAVIQALSRARTVEAVQEIVRGAARRLTGADGATFVLRDGEHCFYADEDAIEPLWKGQRFPMAACISGWTMLRREPAIVEDVYADPRVPLDAYRPTFVKSLVMVPIRTADPIGAIGTYWASRRRATDDDVRFLQALADSASVALENARLVRELELRLRDLEGALETAREAESELRHELEERLRAELELRRTEEQLRHAQKMDAVGKLSGAIAHDFNNLLSVILSYTAIIVGDLRAHDPLRNDIEQIQKAGERAAALTSQLLAFSRQQVLAPRPQDLGDVVRGMEAMVRRLLGAGIELVVHIQPALDSVLVDGGQMEQVVLNLAINARDAMPHGGKLTIEVRNVTLDEGYVGTHHAVSAGRYVLLAVSDTGVGMSKETQLRIFEPFFTTKATGTGLGLSTVYGIVRQSGGHVLAYSELGVGTTLKVYLPRHDHVPVTTPEVTPAVSRSSGTETILVVEDDDPVRLVACGILRRAGYQVLEAKNAGEALLTCEQHPREIHLLLTDVVMPHMSGPALARRLAAERPQMRLVCMSGYADDTALRDLLVDPGLRFVQKPLTPDLLLSTVRQVLDAPTRPDGR